MRPLLRIQLHAYTKKSSRRMYHLKEFETHPNQGGFLRNLLNNMHWELSTPRVVRAVALGTIQIATTMFLAKDQMDQVYMVVTVELVNIKRRWGIKPEGVK